MFGLIITVINGNKKLKVRRTKNIRIKNNIINQKHELKKNINYILKINIKKYIKQIKQLVNGKSVNFSKSARLGI